MWEDQFLQKFVRIEFLPTSPFFLLLPSPFIYLSLPLFLPFFLLPVSFFSPSE